MQKIVPHLWYNTQAKEAALFYIGLFEDSRIVNAVAIRNTPSGDAELVDFELSGQRFKAISAGPYFEFNPSVSLMVSCRSKDEVDDKWDALSENGVVLMPLGEYPFSKRFGWLQDRYGLSWQLMLIDGEQPIQKITPHLLFSGKACGKADEAVQYYTNIFQDSSIGLSDRYGEGEATLPQSKIKYTAFRLCGMDFSAMDHGYDADFSFNEAFSFIINCSDQKEIDYFWEKLSAVPEAEQCGWVRDKFGVSWQIVPESMDKMMNSEDAKQIQRVTQAFLKMKKFDFQALQKAYDGE